jgi:hypothetical protein
LKFLHLFKSSTAAAGFAKIQGYEDIKDIVLRALDSDENYNLLFIGPPASSKTLFLQSILEIRKDGVYFDGSNTTNRILDVLEEERPRIICIDELDKMPRTFQNQLLNFLESGRVKVDQQKKQYQFEIKGAKVFPTCNEINRLSKPLPDLAPMDVVKDIPLTMIHLILSIQDLYQCRSATSLGVTMQMIINRGFNIRWYISYFTGSRQLPRSCVKYSYLALTGNTQSTRTVKI